MNEHPTDRQPDGDDGAPGGDRTLTGPNRPRDSHPEGLPPSVVPFAAIAFPFAAIAPL